MALAEYDYTSYRPRPTERMLRNSSNMHDFARNFSVHTWAASSRYPDLQFRIPQDTYLQPHILSMGMFGFISVVDHQDTYLDAPYSFMLQDGNTPLCYASFIIGGTEIEIHQLQGVYGRRKELFRFGNWTSFLVAAVEEFAEATGMQRVVVLKGSENRWVKENKFPLSAAERRYDQTAKDLGYILEDKYWTKDMSQLHE